MAIQARRRGMVTTSRGSPPRRLELAPAAAITVLGERLTLSGTGFSNQFANQGALLQTTNQGNNWTGNIFLNAGTSWGSIVNTLNVQGSVSGAELTKVGAGALQLLAQNTYTGATTID